MRPEAPGAAATWGPLLARQQQPAVIIGARRKVLAANEAFRARFSGGEDPTGRFCFELIHRSRPPCKGAGGHCPLETAAAGSSSSVHRHLTCTGSAYERVSARRLKSEGAPATLLLVSEPLAQPPVASHLLGGSIAMLRLLERVSELAALDTPVLIRGEQGTGKAFVARHLHESSSRAGRPFVPVDCAAVEIPSLERVLFGNPDNGETGTETETGSSEGLYAAATEGSLFVREPQRLPSSVQTRVARLLRDGEPTCRWLFSIEQEAASPRGALRSSLASLPSLLVPPLRDRMEDLPVLLEALTRRFSDAEPLVLDPAVAEALAGYGFPGNLRELESMVERACLLAVDGYLTPEHFPEDVRSA